MSIRQETVAIDLFPIRSDLPTWAAQHSTLWSKFYWHSSNDHELVRECLDRQRNEGWSIGHLVSAEAATQGYAVLESTEAT